MKQKILISLGMIAIVVISMFLVSAKPYDDNLSNTQDPKETVNDYENTLTYNRFSAQYFSLGLNEYTVRCLSATEQYLYAGTESNGMFRKDLLVPNSVWEQYGFQGQNVRTIFIDPTFPQVIYVGLWVINEAIDPSGAPHSLYKSTDAGQTWFPIDTGISFHDTYDDQTYRIPIYCVRAAAGNPWVVYATSCAQAFKSTNGGATWTMMYGSFDYGGNGVHVITIDPTNPQVLWVGGETNMYNAFVSKSTDGGVTWNGATPGPLGGDNGCYNIIVNPQNPNIVYAGLEGRLAKTINGGQTWSFVLQPTSYPYFRGLVLDDLAPNKVYAGGGHNGQNLPLMIWGTNNKRYWDCSQVTDGGRVFSLTLDRSNHAILYAGTEHGVWKAEITWPRAQTPATPVYD